MSESLNSLYGKLSGLEPVTTDTSSSVLESIALIDKLIKKKLDPELQAVFDSEVRFLRAALKSQAESPIIRMQFGESFDGSLKIAELMKKRQMEKSGAEILDSYLTTVEKGGSKAEKLIRQGNKQGAIVEE